MLFQNGRRFTEASMREESTSSFYGNMCEKSEFFTLQLIWEIALYCIRQNNWPVFRLSNADTAGPGRKNFIMLNHLQFLWWHIAWVSLSSDVSRYYRCINKDFLMWMHIFAINHVGRERILALLLLYSEQRNVWVVPSWEGRGAMLTEHGGVPVPSLVLLHTSAHLNKPAGS